MQDTSRAQTARYFELLRQQTPAERLETAASLSAVVRELALVDIAARFPDTSIRERQWHLADRLYGRDVADRLFAVAE